MPYKTYNFIAGISKMNFKTYMALTIIGTTLRCTYMIYLGKITNINTTTTIIITLALLIGGLLIPIIRKNKSNENLEPEIK